MTAAASDATPILLYNDECAVCRRIAGWVKRSSPDRSGRPSLVVRPIGDDPEALHAIDPGLDIWDAYDTIHLVMPDGSMRCGGEAVAEVLRRVPNCAWFAWSFSVSVFGLRPAQRILDLGYALLSDVRPILGCESCGIPSPWVTFIGSIVSRGNAHRKTRPNVGPHFSHSDRI